MVHGVVDQIPLFQDVEVLGQHFEVFHLQSHVIQTQGPFGNRGGVWSCLEQGQVVVNLATGQERAHSGAFQGNLKPEYLGIELNRCGDIFDI